MPIALRRTSALVACAASPIFAAICAVAQSQQARTPVLVELFTSEGCSSCPPADALLARLLREQPVAGAEIVVLEEHVDYWEGLGWHDRFASHQFTERQTQYARRMGLDSPYTPQMIVDGTGQFVGSDAAHALRAIAQAARSAKAALMLSSISLDGTHIDGLVSPAPGAPILKGDVYVVAVEAMASTQVQGGENGGRTLQHVSVVRAMQRIGGEIGRTPLKFSIPVPNDLSTANLRVIALVQGAGQGAILGSVSSPAVPVRASTSAIATTR